MSGGENPRRSLFEEESRMRRSNCSWDGPDVPLSSQFFSAVREELWLFLIPAVLTLVLLGVFLEEVGFFLRRIPSLRRTRLSLWILGTYPVFAVTSLIALYVPRSSSFCNFIASLYHSITLLKFMGLITDFFGGKSRMLSTLWGKQVSPDPFPWCCCCCLPMVSITSATRGWMMAAVLQLSVLRSVLFFITLVLWTDGRYDYGDVDSVNPNLYVNAIIGASTLLSFYGHLLFYKATKSALRGFGLRAKFICVVVVLVLCGLQSSILETLGALEVFPCSPPFSVLTRSQLIYHYSVIVEMFCIGLYARHTFRKEEPGEPEGGGGPVSERQTGKSVQTHAVQTHAVQTDAVQTDAVQTHAVQTDAVQTHAVQTDAVQTDAVQTDAVQTDAVQTDAVQTDAVQTPHLKLDLPPDEGGSVSNSGYSSDGEDNLCRIEHKPLDGFFFSQIQVGPQRRVQTEEEPRGHSRTDAEPHDFNGVTVV